ncbi:transglutaminase superfamily protein [Chitinophaga niastensis]|uniref:Transglutaminase superfamily protein n=1 Tax=Chitinophaga niastensis TaxID=536980 RepID=A0A2P8HS02_CHINA|nr:transglutaminase domain-containing protein [Chitinophaga niastensis]PSL48964.1 transglutaminase superfamily protein [Chitinophaga niastensis]
MDQHPRRLCLFVALLCITVKSLAFSNEDKNITISEQKERYEFEAGDKENPVIIRQNLSATYRCNQFRTSIPFVAFYDDRSRIDEVRVYVSGSRAKAIKPTYQNYTVDDIFYSDARICALELPLEKKGAESTVELDKTVLDPRYFSAVYFTEGYEIASKEIQIVIPRWMKVEIREMNFDKFDIRKTAEYNSKRDVDIYTYTAKQLPARVKETNAPGPSYVYPHLLILSKYADLKTGRVNYFNKTADLYAWYHSLVKEIGDDETVVKAKALEITKGISADTAKINAVYHWMQDNIRYIAFEDGIAGFKPEKVQNVLQHKYGDCKGMANLTRGLLKALGYDARLCWIGTDHIAYDYSIPSLAVDNHMICALNYKGKRYFLDATETYIGLDQYAQRIQGRQVMIEDGEKYILDHVPSRNWQQNSAVEKRVLHIDNGALAGKVQQQWDGESKEDLLTQVHGIKKEKLQDALLQYLAENNNKYHINNIHTSDLANWDKLVDIQYELQYQDAVTGFGDELYTELDFRKELSGFIIDTAKREHDMLFSYKHHVINETTLEVPAGYKVGALPEDLKIDRPDYAFNITYKLNSGKIAYHKELIIKNAWLAKAGFCQWNTDIQALDKAYLQQITLSKK